MIKKNNQQTGKKLHALNRHKKDSVGINFWEEHKLDHCEMKFMTNQSISMSKILTHNFLLSKLYPTNTVTN